jgi:hypothetical protein
VVRHSSIAALRMWRWKPRTRRKNAYFEGSRFIKTWRTTKALFAVKNLFFSRTCNKVGYGGTVILSMGFAVCYPNIYFFFLMEVMFNLPPSMRQQVLSLLWNNEAGSGAKERDRYDSWIYGKRFAKKQRRQFSLSMIDLKKRCHQQIMAAYGIYETAHNLVIFLTVHISGWHQYHPLKRSDLMMSMHYMRF